MGHREWSRNKPRWCAWLEACPGSGDCGVQRVLLHCVRPQTWVTDLSSTQFFRLPSSWGRKRAQRVRIRFWSLTAWVQIPALPLTIRVPWSELFVPCNSVLSPAQQTESHLRKNWVSWEERCLEQCLTQWALTECLLSWWPLICFFRTHRFCSLGHPF